MSGSKHSRSLPLFMAAVLLATSAGGAVAAEIRVVVASNFAETFKIIAGRFEARTGHQVIPIFGSSGKHYAQLRNGAPFDAFFSADAERPALLEREELALPGSRFTYALGRLLLWSPEAGYVDPDGDVLADQSIRHLAIANPKLAPYGRAAQEVLQALGRWQSFQGRLVRGENIAQTFQFVKSGNAPLGFIARSQVQRPGRPVPGSSWKVPAGLHAPIEQQAVQLRASRAARELLAFVRNEESRLTIRGFGYGTPDAE